MAKRSFKKDDGRELPVSDEFLLPFLSPASPGTRYWEPPPPGPVSDRQRGRVVLQLHQARAVAPLAAEGIVIVVEVGRDLVQQLERAVGLAAEIETPRLAPVEVGWIPERADLVGRRGPGSARSRAGPATGAG